MATITNLVHKPYTSLSTFHHTASFFSSPSSTTPNFIRTYKPKSSTNLKLQTSNAHLITKARASTSGAQKALQINENVQQVHSIEDFDEALRLAKNKLVVVQFASNHSYHTNKIYPFMVDLSQRWCNHQFLLVMGEESEKTRELCSRENVNKVPHFIFYKNSKKIQEEERFEPDQLIRDIKKYYYGDNNGSSVVQLDHREDVEQLIEDHKVNHKLIVLDVGLENCVPCAKVYPSVIQLSKQMNETVVFAIMNGEKNESCIQFLKDMSVTRVPTFLFIRDGEMCGRYVGSAGGELLREIQKHQSSHMYEKKSYSFSAARTN